jgi:predicted transposase/invertase (TIGR01784 family)
MHGLPTVPGMELLDPKNDYVFKRLFADSPELLAALISAVRQGEPPVQVLQVLNPRILPEDITGKAIELDVLARDSRGRLFNVEVQVQRFPRWSARSTFYLARLLGSQIGSGQNYVDLRPVEGIHLLDFDLFEDHPSALWHFEMRDRNDPSVRLGDELSLYVVELRKADRRRRGAGDDAGVGAGTGVAHPELMAWIAFLEHWKEAKQMSELSYPAVQQALDKLQTLSQNEEDRYRAIARERALFNEMTLLRHAREEGREEGLEVGWEKGRGHALTRQLTRRFGPLPDWVALQVQHASATQLDTWLDRVLDASTLEAVFADH